MRTRAEKLNVNSVDPALMRIKKRYAGFEDLTVYLSLGGTAAREIARRADAVIEIGRRRVYDLEKIDAFLDANQKIELKRHAQEVAADEAQ